MSAKPHAGPTLVPLEPEKVAALKALVERDGIAAAMRATGLGRLAIASIIGRGSAPVAQSALLDRSIMGRGRPFL